MANDVFRAVDAVLVLGVDDTTSLEGELADELITEYNFSNTVGRLSDVTIMVSTTLMPFYEIGRRYPTHLHPGIIIISGTAERAHVNGALLRLLLGSGAVSPPSSANFAQPSFNLITTTTNPAIRDQFTRIAVFGVKFESWAYHIPSEDFVMEAVRFQALRIAFEEQ
jgi:hypothetical protein